MASVNACPTTKAEVNIAAKRNGCRNGTNGRSSYMCIPNKEKTTLVEFCYNENIGIHEKGNCLEANLGRITEHSCSNFFYGCPDSDYFKDELYKYPACQNINTNNHCYVMDPLCQSKTLIVESNDSGVFYTCFTVCGIAFLIIGAILLYLYLKQRRKKGNGDKNKKDDDVKKPLLDQHTVKDRKDKEENDQTTDRNRGRDTEEKTQNTVKDGKDTEENDQTTDRNIGQDTEEKAQNTVKDGKDTEENDQTTDRNIGQETEEKTQNTVKDGKDTKEKAQNTVKDGKDTEEKAQNTVKDGKDTEENDQTTDRNIGQDTEEKTHSTVKDGKDTEENAQKTVKDGKDKEENGGGQLSPVKMKRRHPFAKVKKKSETKK